MKSIIISFVLIFGVNAFALSSNPEAITLNDIEILKKGLPLFDKNKKEDKAILKKYLTYYNLDHESLERVGYLKTPNYNIGVLSFQNEEPKGTFILSHGFMDHSGYLHRLINHLLKENYNVIAYDLPGHGLSSGTPFNIYSFEEYQIVLESVLTQLVPFISGDIYFVGFSTGAVGMLRSLVNEDDLGFKKIFLAAPLIEVQKSKLLDSINYVASRLTDKLPRIPNEKTSSDPEFHNYRKLDPLSPDYTRTNWYTQYYYWSNYIQKFEGLEFENVHLIQGDKDSTVNPNTNINWISKAFPNSSVSVIKGASHQLLFEKDKYTKQVLEIITKTLEK